jgi:hypothetical protein
MTCTRFSRKSVQKLNFYLGMYENGQFQVKLIFAEQVSVCVMCEPIMSRRKTLYLLSSLRNIFRFQGLSNTEILYRVFRFSIF